MDPFMELFRGIAERIGATAVIRALAALFGTLRERLLRAPQSQQRDLITKSSQDLDLLVRDLAPAFELGKDTSLPVLVFHMNRGQDAEWRGVHDKLLILQAWFHTWTQQRSTMVSIAPLTAEHLIVDIETLVSIALFTSWAGVEMSKWAHDLSPEDRGYHPWKATSQRFDLFLTKLEGFLRALPGELVTPTVAQHELFPRMSL